MTEAEIDALLRAESQLRIATLGPGTGINLTPMTFGWAGGKVYLHSGKDGTLIRAWTCRVMGDTFGFDATGMGDVDGDGATDFLLTSAWSGIRGVKSGRVFVLAGDRS